MASKVAPLVTVLCAFLAAPAVWSHILAPPNVPTGGTQYNASCTASGNVVDIQISLSPDDPPETLPNDFHIEACFETNTAQEFSTAADHKAPPGAACGSAGCKATPGTVPNWTTFQAIVTWTVNGEKVHYEELEINR